MADPIHQFEIKKIVPLELNNIDISFTNSSMFMILAVLVVSIFLILSIKNKKILIKIEKEMTTKVDPFNSLHLGQETFFISNLTSEKNFLILFIYASNTSNS